MVDKFEEYKLFIDDTARFTERRQSVATTYLTVNSILLSAIALLLNRDITLADKPLAWSIFFLAVGGIFACFVWFQLVKKYKKLVGFRMKHLKIIEDLPEMEGSYKMYQKEDELYPRAEAKEYEQAKFFKFGFSDLESTLPFLFIFLYIAIPVIGIFFNK